MPPIDALLDELFAGKRPPLYHEVAEWVRTSRRFRAFTYEYRSKIRAKISRVRGAEEMDDLRAELQTAVILCQQAQFTVAYERYAASKQRGADFTITWRTHTPVNIEVRRMRGTDVTQTDEDARATKLVYMLLDKIGQTAPGMINLLWLMSEEPIAQEEIARVMQALRNAAEQKAEPLFVRGGYQSAVEFLRRYQQLSGIAVHMPDGAYLWQNPLARHKLPPALATALLQKHSD